MKVNFIIPIRHPDLVVDKEKQYKYLNSTFFSISQQNDLRYAVYVVGNSNQVLPPLPPKFKFVPVEYLKPENYVNTLGIPMNLENYYISVQRDKGKRVCAALDLIQDMNSYVMVVDDDDFISNSLVQYILKQKSQTGLFITKGFRYNSSRNTFEKMKSFYKVCGTSIIVPITYYSYMQRDIDVDYAIREAGSHVLIVEKIRTHSLPFAPIPFYAAIYRNENINSTQPIVQTLKKYETTKETPQKTKSLIFSPLAWIVRVTVNLVKKTRLKLIDILLNKVLIQKIKKTFGVVSE